MLDPARILEKEHRELNAKLTEKRLIRAGIPRRFRDADFSNHIPAGHMSELLPVYSQARTYIEDIDRNIQAGNGLIFYGKPGNGKTTLAVAILKEALKKGYSGYFIPMVSLVDKLLTMSKEERVQFEERISTTKLLVIDDLGGESDQGWVLNKVDAIITARYNEMLPIIVTTNINVKSKEMEKYNDRILDRLVCTCRLIQFTGESMR